MLTGLEKSGRTQNFNKEIENIKRNMSDLKNTVTKMENILEGINSRLEDTEERISNLEDRIMVSIPVKSKKKIGFKKVYINRSLRQYQVNKCAHYTNSRRRERKG